MNQYELPVLRRINLPNLVTLGGIGAGILSLHFLAMGRLDIAGLCVLAAMGCDQLDGPVARKLGQVSRFGGFLDVFGDCLAYGVFPVMAIRLVTGGNWVALIFGLMFFFAAMMRLAYYLETETKDMTIGTPCVILLLGLPWSGSVAAEWHVPAAALFCSLSTILLLSGVRIQRRQSVGMLVMILPFIPLVIWGLRLWA